MKGRYAMEAEMKPWRCDKDDPSSHVLGWVRKNGNGVKTLVLLRQALDIVADPAIEVDVMAVVEGGPVMEIRCSVCGRSRGWFPDAEQLRRLVAAVRGGQVDR
jgi:hypothetical protein